jgi:hypothetical protein
MKRVFVLDIFFLVGTGVLAQNKDSDENSQDKNKKETTDNKDQSEADQEKKQLD